MKLIKKSIYTLAMMSVMGLWSCSSEEFMPGQEMPKEAIPVTVTVGRSEAATRTIIEEDATDGSLSDVWAANDVLEVYYADGANAGQKAATLELIKGVGESNGVFKGTIESPSATGNYRLWYFGHPVKDAQGKNTYPKLNFNPNQDNNRIALDMSNTAFKTAGELASLDILTKDVEISQNNGEYTLVGEDNTVRMDAFLAMARFSLAGVLPENTEGYVTICNKDTQAQEGVDKPAMDRYAEFDPANGKTYYYQYTTPKYCVLDDVNSKDDIYIAFLPGTYKLGFTFVTKDNTVYRYNFASPKKLEKGKYYRAFAEATEENTEGTISGVEVPFELESANYNNPGDMASWAGNETDLEVLADVIDIEFVSNADGWTLNDTNKGSEHYGGFGYYIEYKRNGTLSGIMTSKKNGRKDSSAIFYQWGRWLGFPYCVNFIETIPTGAANIYTDELYAELFPYKVNYGELKIGYSWYNSLSGVYVCTYMGGNTSWTKQRAINCSICYALGEPMTGHLDYVFNNEETTWEERGFNPAPDGYSIPSANQLQALIPESENGKITTNTAQVKIIDGVKYAMRWVKTSVNVGGTSKLNAVEIRSFKTYDNKVTNKDSRFDSAKKIQLVTYGYLDNKGDLQNEGSRGYFWSNETGVNTLSGSSGNGGQALVAYINGNNIQMLMTVMPRTFAANVYLIKEEGKKSDTIKPWFPLTGVGTPHWY